MTVDVDSPAPSLEDRLALLGPLADPARRSLYLYVTAQPGDVSRDEAAAATGLQRTTAAFHLDKLAEAGLLETRYRRLSGRRGPGAGRPNKLYRRSSRDHELSLPPRNYGLAAELLVEALEGASPAVQASLTRVARRHGEALGRQIRAQLGSRAGKERTLAAVAPALERFGYQPHRQGDDLRLTNCPFHALTDEHRELVCAMNLSLLGGVVEGMGVQGLEARPEPSPEGCCVTVGLRAARRRAPSRPVGRNDAAPATGRRGEEDR